MRARKLIPHNSRLVWGCPWLTSKTVCSYWPASYLYLYVITRLINFHQWQNSPLRNTSGRVYAIWVNKTSVWQLQTICFALRDKSATMTAAILCFITALLCVITVNEACKCAVVHPQTNFCNADFGKILFSCVFPFLLRLVWRLLSFLGFPVSL